MYARTEPKPQEVITEPSLRGLRKTSCGRVPGRSLALAGKLVARMKILTIENEVQVEADLYPRVDDLSNKLRQLRVFAAIDPWEIGAVDDFKDESGDKVSVL